MNESLQQEALDLLAEAGCSLGNAAQHGMAKETAAKLLRKIFDFMRRVEDETGMTNSFE